MGETAKRTASGILLAIYFVFSFNYDGFYRIPLFLFLFVFVAIGLHEFYTMTSISDSQRPYKKTGTVIGLTILTLVFLYALPKKYPADFAGESVGLVNYIKAVHLGFHLLTALLFFLMVLAFIWQLKCNRTEGSVYNVAVTLLGVIYVALTSSHLFLLDAMPWGTFYIWLLAFMTTMSDTMQYAAGRTFGKTKVGFAVSPNKSWEGYIGGLIGQVILTQIFYFSAKQFFEIPEFSVVELAFFSMIIYFLSIVGDLSESLIKRDTNVKDSGKLIPGHGGVLDLIDALLLTIPTSYYMMVLRDYVKSLNL